MATTSPQSNPADADAGAGAGIAMPQTKTETPMGRGGGMRRARDSTADLASANKDTFQKARSLKGVAASKDVGGGDDDGALTTTTGARKKGRRRSIMTVRTLDDSLRGSQTSLSQSQTKRRERRRSSQDFLLNASMHSAPAGAMLLPPDESFDDSSRHQRAISANPKNTSGFAVKFESVEIREFPITLGDNPSVSQGAPFTIDWEPQEIYDPVGLEEYESSRPPRRDYLQMAIPSSIRKDMLLKSGFTNQQIVTGCRDLNFERTRRKKSMQVQHLDGLHESLEKAKRGLKNIVIKGRKKKERDLIRRSMDAERQMEKQRAAEWAAEEELLTASQSSRGTGHSRSNSMPETVETKQVVVGVE